MFDISFVELVVIAVVALLVLGPDRLPDAIRTAALWIGRAKRSFNKAKAEIEQQLNADDIRRQLHNESILKDIEEARRDANKLIRDTQQDLEKTKDSVNQAVDNARAMAVVTNSAEEGLPTTPLERSGPEAGNAINVTTNATAATPEGAAEPAATEAEVSTPDVAEPDTGAGESSDANDVAADAVSAPQPSQNAAPVQDFYNSPPTGRVKMEDGKFYAVEGDDEGEESEEAADTKSAPPRGDGQQ